MWGPAEFGADVAVAADGEVFEGSATAADMLSSSLAAYVDALSEVELTGTLGCIPRKAQFSGAVIAGGLLRQTIPSCPGESSSIYWGRIGGSSALSRMRIS